MHDPIRNKIHHLGEEQYTCYDKKQQGLLLAPVSCLVYNSAYRLLPLPMRLTFFFFFFFFAFCCLLVFPMMFSP